MRSVAHYRKWIAPFLAAAMILCGICLDLGQADAIFPRAGHPAEKATETYLARTLVSRQESPCTTEQLGLKNAQALTESGRSSEHNLKVILGLFLFLRYYRHGYGQKKEKTRSGHWYGEGARSGIYTGRTGRNGFL